MSSARNTRIRTIKILIYNAIASRRKDMEEKKTAIECFDRLQSRRVNENIQFVIHSVHVISYSKTKERRKNSRKMTLN